jgi:hypothetical protein
MLLLVLATSVTLGSVLSDEKSSLSFVSPFSFFLSFFSPHYDRQSVGQSVLVSGALLGLATNFIFASKFSSDSCRFAKKMVKSRVGPITKHDSSVS